MSITFTNMKMKDLKIQLRHFNIPFIYLRQHMGNPVLLIHIPLKKLYDYKKFDLLQHFIVNEKGLKRFKCKPLPLPGQQNKINRTIGIFGIRSKIVDPIFIPLSKTNWQTRTKMSTLHVIEIYGDVGNPELFELYKKHQKIKQERTNGRSSKKTTPNN